MIGGLEINVRPVGSRLAVGERTVGGVDACVERRRLGADVRAGVGVVGSAVDGDEYGGPGRLGEVRIIGAVDEPRDDRRR
jgi:hypothetical protein